MNRATRGLLVLIVLLVAMALAAFVINQTAPQTTTATVRDCVRTLADVCVALPQAEGVNLLNETIRLPEVLEGAYNLVVMPFDRDQQVRAADWLPVFAELAAQDDTLRYYSIAALPDLAPAFRLLISGGMNAAIRDEATRRVAILLYLANQEAFLQALNIPNTDTIQLFIFNQAGEALWQGNEATTTPEQVAAVWKQIQPEDKP